MIFGDVNANAMNNVNDENVTAKRLADACFTLARHGGWWDDVAEPWDKAPEKLLLIHSEVSEACEAHRKNLVDDKLPHRHGVEVELADAVIRIFDLAGALDMDVVGAMQEKLIFNQTRQDHKKENREAEGGKKY